jgi:pilus assembly protein CpaE
MRARILIDLRLHSEKLKRLFAELLAKHPELTARPSQSTGHPDVLIIELDETDPSVTFTQIRGLQKSSPQTQILLTASRADNQVLLDALRAGVKEFLPVPFTQDDAEQALCRLKERIVESHPEAEKPKGQIIGIIAAKGGLGTSSLTVNLGCSLLHVENSKSVVLVDLDIHSSDLPLFLDIEPIHSLKEIANDYERVDKLFLMNLLSKHESGLYLLPSGYDDRTDETFSPRCVEHTLTLLRSMFDYVVVDCGALLDDSTRTVLKLSSSILVVSTFHVPVVRSTKRLLDLLRGMGQPSPQLRVVMNRYNTRAEALLKNTETSLQHKLFAFIPNNFDLASSAINNGQPVSSIAPNSDLAKSYQRLAASLSERSAKDTTSATSGYFRLLKGMWSKKTADAVAAL